MERLKNTFWVINLPHFLRSFCDFYELLVPRHKWYDTCNRKQMQQYDVKPYRDSMSLHSLKVWCIQWYTYTHICLWLSISCYLEPCVCSLSELKESNSCLISISSEEPVYSGRNPIIPSSDRGTRLSVDWLEVEGPAAEAWNSTEEFTRPFSSGLERIFSMGL